MSSSSLTMDIRRELKKKLIILSILRLDPELSTESQVYIHSKLLEAKIAHDLATVLPLDKDVIAGRRGNVNSNQTLSETFKTFWEAFCFNSHQSENQEVVNIVDVIRFFRVMYCAILSCSLEDLVFNIEDEVSYYEAELGMPLNMFTFTDALIDFFELWSDLLIPSHHSKFIIFIIALLIKFPSSNEPYRQQQQQCGSSNLLEPRLNIKDISEIRGPYNIFRITNFNHIIQNLQSNATCNHIFEFTSYSLDKCIKVQKSLLLYYQHFKKIDGATNSDEKSLANEQKNDDFSQKSDDRSQSKYSIRNYSFSPFFRHASDEKIAEDRNDFESKILVNDEDVIFKSEDDGRSYGSRSTSLLQSCSSSMELFELFSPTGTDGLLSNSISPSFDDMKYISSTFAAFAVSRDKSLIPLRKFNHSQTMYSIFQSSDTIPNELHYPPTNNAFPPNYNKDVMSMSLSGYSENSYNSLGLRGRRDMSPPDKITNVVDFHKDAAGLEPKRIVDFFKTSAIKVPFPISPGSLSHSGGRKEFDFKNRKSNSPSRKRLDSRMDDVLTDQIDDNEHHKEQIEVTDSNIKPRNLNMNEPSSNVKADIFKLQESVSMDSLLFDHDLLKRKTVQEILFKSKNIITKDVTATDYFKPNVKVADIKQNLGFSTLNKYKNGHFSSWCVTDPSATGFSDDKLLLDALRLTNPRAEIGSSNRKSEHNTDNESHQSSHNESQSSGQTFNIRHVNEDYLDSMGKFSPSNDNDLESESSSANFDAENMSRFVENQTKDLLSNPNAFLIQKYNGKDDDLSFGDNSMLSDDISESSELVIMRQIISRQNSSNVNNLYRGPSISRAYFPPNANNRIRQSKQMQMLNSYSLVGTSTGPSKRPSSKERNNSINSNANPNPNANNNNNTNNKNEKHNHSLQRQVGNSVFHLRKDKGVEKIKKNNFNFNKKLRPLSPVGMAIKSYKENNASKISDTDINEKGLVYDSTSLPSDPQFFVKKYQINELSHRQQVPTNFGENAFSEYNDNDSIASNEDNSRTSKSCNTTNNILNKHQLSAIMRPIAPHSQSTSNNLLLAPAATSHSFYQSASAHMLKAVHPLTSVLMLDHEQSLRHAAPAPWIPQGALETKCHDRSNLKFAWELQRDFDKLVKVDPCKNKVFMKKQDALREVFEDYVKPKGVRRLT